MMSRALSFRATETCKVSGITFDLICITYGNEVIVTSDQFFDDLEHAIKTSKILPDCLVVIADNQFAPILKTYWDNDLNARDAILARGEKKSHNFIKSYYFYSWTSTSINLINSHHSPSVQEYSVPIEKVIQHGLRFLLIKNEVVQIAPAGHTFRHPSNTVNKIFIQARELASSEPELKFVANSICLVKGDQLKNAKVVLIDTMGIYNYVREAVKAVGGNAEIESFHSYDDIGSISPPPDQYMCVISASTSGGMAKKFKIQGFNPDNIMTLVDKSENNRVGSVLIALDLISNIYEQVLGDGSETEIEIVGEHFSSKAKPPKPITLGLPHTPPALSNLLKHFAKERVRSLNYKPSTSYSSTKLLSLNVSELEKVKEFSDWLKEELAWSVSISVDHIIYADEQSEKIAILAAEMIKNIQKRSSLPPLIPYKSIDSKTLTKARGVLIVSAIAGDGSALREISRDLREYIGTEVPRHFLVVVGLPQAEETWERLKQFLVRNPTKRLYGFSNWMYLPVGYDGKDNAWGGLADLAKKAQLYQGVNDASLTISNDVIEESYEKASKVISSSYHQFLPKTSGAPLGLTSGFLFFGEHFKTTFKQIPASAVYLTIASVLQRARELKDVDNQLKPSGYESVVLAPECFHRFNDNILQACLLRAAYPFELDYSASSHHSKLMKEFLAKVFLRHEHNYGDAALEFAAALATKRLKLKSEDFEELIQSSIQHLKKNSSALLGLLLLARK